MRTYELETEEETKKGNPIARMRFRYQSYTKDTDEPCQSEWCQLKSDAIKYACMELVRDFKKFGKDEIVMKVFNEMNHKQPPIVITLEYALKFTA